MSQGEVDDLINQLAKTTVEIKGVTFEGQTLRLNTEEDAEKVAEAITNCENMEFLNLDGNTVGVEAAKVIGKALSGKPEFKRALWNNMFSGRMKTEIPKALEFLGAGIISAGATLTELVLSDNAFGPVGLAGLETFIRSPSCHSLQILRLNNNGLGIQGAKLLSNALLDAIESSKKLGKPMALKVFVAGRNRLENEGAKLLARVFKELKTLEELSMPINGIYHQGLSVLTSALSENPNLRIVNLNDNTVGGHRGAVHLATMLPHLKHLQKLNLGDCLLKTSGALVLAEALAKGNNSALEELYLDSNEIKANGGLELVKALNLSVSAPSGESVVSGQSLKVLDLKGNQFGEEGIKKMHHAMGARCDILSVSDDEGDDDDDDVEEEDNSNDEEEEESEEENENEELHKEKKNEEKPEKKVDAMSGNMSVEQFLGSPLPSSFESLGKERKTIILERIKQSQPKPQAKDSEKEDYIEEAVEILMKLSSLARETKLGQPTGKGTQSDPASDILSCSMALYEELFRWADEADKLSTLTNCLLVNMGLIKSEDKKKKDVKWDMEGVMLSLEKAFSLPNFPRSTKDALECFLVKFNPTTVTLQKSKLKLMTAIYKM